MSTTSTLPTTKAHSKLQRLLQSALGTGTSSSDKRILAALLSNEAVGNGTSTGSDHPDDSVHGDGLSDSAAAATADQLIEERARDAAAWLADALHSAELVTRAPGKGCSHLKLQIAEFLPK